MRPKGLGARLNGWMRAKFDSEQFSYESLRAMFFPLVMDQLFIFGIGMLSTAMISSSGESAVAAVNLVGGMGALAYAVFTAVSMGGSIVIARAKGAGDPERVREAIGQATGGCFLLAVVFTAVLYAFSDGLVRALYPAAEEKLVADAVSYLRVYCVSLPPYAIFCVIFSAFRSLGDAKSSLILTVVINSVHLVCSFVFINLMKLAVTGSALSYVAARAIGVAFSLYWLLRKAGGMRMRAKHFFRFDKMIVRDIARLGVPFSFEQCLFQGGMLLVQMYLALLTTTDLAAHGVANSIFSLYYAVAYAVATMTSTVCGQCVGAGHIELARRYAKSFVSAGRWVLLAAVLVLFPLTPLIMRLYAPSEAGSKIIWLALAIGALPMPLTWCDGYIIPAATRAAGDAAFTTVVSLLSLAAGRMAAGYLFAIPLGFGVAGVWMGQLIEWILRALVMRARIGGDKWIHVKQSA